MAQRLKDIHVEQIDLVGNPAIRRGVTLFKSQPQSGGNEVDKEQLMEVLKGLSDEDKATVAEALGTEAPNVIELVKALDDEGKAAIRKALESEDDDDKKAQGAVAKLFEALGITKKTAEDPLKDETPAVRKAMGEMADRVEKAETQANAADGRAEKAEQKVSKMEEDRERDKYISEAQALGNIATGDDFGEVLHHASKSMDDEQFKKLQEVLKGANEQATITAEIGSVAHGEVDAESALKKMGEQLFTDKPDLYPTIEQAHAHVTKTNPQLYARVVKEQNDRKRKA